MDADHPGRRQHPGQLHPHQRARLHPQPPDGRHGRRIHDHDGRARRRRRGRRDHGAFRSHRPARTAFAVTPSASTAPTARVANSFFNKRERPAQARTSAATSSAARSADRSCATGCSSSGTTKALASAPQVTQNNVIPAHDDSLPGRVPLCRTRDGQVQAVERAASWPGFRLDPVVARDILADVPSASNVNNFDVGNSTADALLNTAGYRVSARRAQPRGISGACASTTRRTRPPFRGELRVVPRDRRPRATSTAVHERPVVFTDSTVQRYVGGVALAIGTPSPTRCAAEATSRRCGSRTPGASAAPSSRCRSSRTPSCTFQPQGRDTRTFQYSDNGVMAARTPRAAVRRTICSRFACTRTDYGWTFPIGARSASAPRRRPPCSSQPRSCPAASAPPTWRPPTRCCRFCPARSRRWPDLRGAGPRRRASWPGCRDERNYRLNNSSRFSRTTGGGNPM